jgi:hypothetical protein
MTTDLTLARPIRVPFEFERYRFRPRDLRTVLPDDVVDHLKKTSPSAHGMDPAEMSEEDLLDMPPAGDLPVVAFARLNRLESRWHTGSPMVASGATSPSTSSMAGCPEGQRSV